MTTSAPPKIGEPADQWPLTTAVKRREGNRQVADSILSLPRVVRWIWQAGDIHLADRRACTLITGVAVALHNARQPFVTSKRHRNHYMSLADRIERNPGKKRLVKLQRDMGNDKAVGFQRYKNGDDMVRLANAARVFAEACDDPNWTSPSPYHDHAARNDFIRALTALQKWCAVTSSHVLTMDIVNALFLEQVQQTDAAEVERLTRSKSPKKRRGVV